MRASIDIIIAGPKDAEVLAQLAQKTHFDTYSALVSDRVDSIKAYALTELSQEKIETELANARNFYFLIRAHHEIAGYAKVALDHEPAGLKFQPSLHLDRFYLLPPWQRQGIGRSFVSSMKDFARARGLQSLWLRVFEGNSASLRFHESLGFEARQRLEWRFTWQGIDYTDYDILFESAI